MGMRGEFEAWVSMQPWGVDYRYRYGDTGPYLDIQIQIAWSAWQASRATLVIAVKRYVDDSINHEWAQSNDGWAVDYTELSTSLAAAGVTINTTTVNGGDAS